MARKSDTVYRVVCDVPGASLTTVLGVLEGSATIVKLEPVGDAPAPAKMNGHRYAGGRRNKGISGQDLVLKVCRAYRRPVSVEEMRAEFVKAGFAESSWSPVVSKLEVAKRIERGDNGYIALRKAK